VYKRQLLGVSVPVEYGGQGGDFRHDLVVVDQVARKGVEGFAASLHNVIVTPYVQMHGTEEQKRQWLPALSNGDRVAAIAMSEPGAGSDLQAIRTTALKDGNGYRINGAKTFISNGQIADLIVVVAKTDPAQGARGVSLLVVEPDEVEGFRRGRKLDKIGNDAQDTSELFFDDVWVPAQNLLGMEEGRSTIPGSARRSASRCSIFRTPSFGWPTWPQRREWCGCSSTTVSTGCWRERSTTRHPRWPS
jgi:alkylation response protein AidB-like acyl-CoA dehydrogenase